MQINKLINQINKEHFQLISAPDSYFMLRLGIAFNFSDHEAVIFLLEDVVIATNFDLFFLDL